MQPFAHYCIYRVFKQHLLYLQCLYKTKSPSALAVFYSEPANL